MTSSRLQESMCGGINSASQLGKHGSRVLLTGCLCAYPLQDGARALCALDYSECVRQCAFSTKWRSNSNTAVASVPSFPFSLVILNTTPRSEIYTAIFSEAVACPCAQTT